MQKERLNLPKKCGRQILVRAAKKLLLTKTFIVINMNYKFAVILTGRLKIVNLCHRAPHISHWQILNKNVKIVYFFSYFQFQSPANI